MITVWIDEITPCLKDNETGQIIETEVMKVRRKSTLSAYNKKNGWYVDWKELFDDNDLYALVIKGTYDIQGLVAVCENNPDALYVSWMCAAPHNNPQIVTNKKYNGVGGHLFAIAMQQSELRGYDGSIYGFAANKELLEHYQKAFNAEWIGMLHQYHFIIDGSNMKSIKEVYTYDINDNEL
jgi:hypothetical protein